MLELERPDLGPGSKEVQSTYRIVTQTPSGFPCGCGVWVTIKAPEKTASFSLWFYLPGFQNGHPVLTHSHAEQEAAY